MTELPAPAADQALGRIATAAVLAVGLGLAVQALVLAAKTFGGATLEAASAAVDVLAGITWSVVVCVGVAAATSAFRARPAVAGIVALACAPIALALAKAAQQVLSAAMKVSGQPGALPLTAIAGVRALEYGVLGFALATLANRATNGASPYLLAGLGAGLVFGGAIVSLNVLAGAASPAIAASAVNEILFPLGCAGVVYVGRIVGRAAGG